MPKVLTNTATESAFEQPRDRRNDTISSWLLPSAWSWRH
jgi:hypothetical protein